MDLLFYMVFVRNIDRVARNFYVYHSLCSCSIGSVTKRLRILSIPSNDKVRNHLVANTFSLRLVSFALKVTRCAYVLVDIDF